MPAKLRPAAFAIAARAAGRYDAEQWRRITAPVVSVRGERDVFSGAEDAAEFARRIPRLAGHRLVGAGHFTAIERPDTLSRLSSGRRYGRPPRKRSGSIGARMAAPS